MDPVSELAVSHLPRQTQYFCSDESTVWNRKQKFRRRYIDVSTVYHYECLLVGRVLEPSHPRYKIEQLKFMATTFQLISRKQELSWVRHMKSLIIAVKPTDGAWLKIEVQHEASEISCIVFLKLGPAELRGSERRICVKAEEFLAVQNLYVRV